MHLCASLQLKNAKQMQQAAEAAKRREEEILRAKAENQQQQDDEQNRIELSTQEGDVSKPSESEEQSALQEEERTSGGVSAVQLTATDQDSPAKTAGNEVSSCVVDSDQVTTEVNTDVIPDDKVQDDPETQQHSQENDHREAESAVAESTTEVQISESSEKPENVENATCEPAVVTEVLPVVVVASSEGEVILTADVSTQSDLSPSGSQSHIAESSDISLEQQQPAELPMKPEQLITDADKTRLDIADDTRRSVSDESSDAYTDVLEDETDHLSDILEGQDTMHRREDIEYVELCDESSSTVEPNANKDDTKDETEKELDSILDDVHLDESEHGNCHLNVQFYYVSFTFWLLN